MLSLRGHAPCRSLFKQSSPSTSVRVSCKPYNPLRLVQQQSNKRRLCTWNAASFSKSSTRSHIRCSAQEDEVHTPEVLNDLEMIDNLPSTSHSPEEQQLSTSSGPQQLASWALGGQRKGLTSLLGFAGVAVAGIGGKPLLHKWFVGFIHLQCSPRSHPSWQILFIRSHGGIQNHIILQVLTCVVLAPHYKRYLFWRLLLLYTSWDTLWQRGRRTSMSPSSA